MQNEQLYPVVRAVELVSGQRLHVSTIIRWATHGTKGVRLEALKLGQKWLCSQEAVRRYMEQATAARESCEILPTMTPRQKTLAANRAAKKLAEKLGVG